MTRKKAIAISANRDSVDQIGMQVRAGLSVHEERKLGGPKVRSQRMRHHGSTRSLFTTDTESTYRSLAATPMNAITGKIA